VGWHRYCSDRCKWHAKRIQERPLILGRCGFCTEIFETNQPQKIFCSTKCQRKAASQRASSRTGYERIRVRMDRVRAKAEREAADLANPRHCAECGTLLPPGCDRRKIYCSTRCNTAVQNRKKLNGHAPQPTPDRPDPARSGNGSCRGPDGARRGPKEQPKYTPLEALQIAKSRCVTLMLAAIDAAEARRRREFRPWRRRSWDRKQKEPRGLAAAK